MRELRLASRESPLALRQAEMVREFFRQRFPDLPTRVVSMTTEGDRKLEASLITEGGKGLFVKEIEHSLLDGRADAAVHSLKDLPTESPEGLVVGAIGQREDPRDVLVSREGAGIWELPRGARIGTSSLRRSAQLRHLRPDIEVVPIRGNLETRLGKLEGLDAVILAAAGLRRLGLDRYVSRPLSPAEMLPAAGQGALALEVRTDDPETAERVRAFDHAPSRIAVLTERFFLAALGGGCQVPVGAHAEVIGERITLQGVVAAPDGSSLLRITLEGTDPRELGERAAERLLRQGAADLLGSLP